MFVFLSEVENRNRMFVLDDITDWSSPVHRSLLVVITMLYLSVFRATCIAFPVVNIALTFQLPIFFVVLSVNSDLVGRWASFR